MSGKQLIVFVGVLLMGLTIFFFGNVPETKKSIVETGDQNGKYPVDHSIQFEQKQMLVGGGDLFSFKNFVPSDFTGMIIWSGMSAHDFNKDGVEDLLVVGYHNRKNNARVLLADGKGGFTDTSASEYGIESFGLGRGALFADIDNDGDDDAVVVNNDAFIIDKEAHEREGGIYLYKQDDSGKFIDDGYLALDNVISPVLFDFDLDGDSDLLFSRYAYQALGYKFKFYSKKMFVLENRDGQIIQEPIYLNEDMEWSNDKDYWKGPETHADGCNFLAGLKSGYDAFDFSLGVADINNDGYMDIVSATDFAKSYVLLGSAEGVMSNTSAESTFEDCNAMGSVIADFDNDMDLDWFTVNVYDPAFTREDTPSSDWGIKGNQMYINDGEGKFAPVDKGVKDGTWGWGACGADFNNDGFTDIAHVTGMSRDDIRNERRFAEHHSRLFISHAGEYYREQSLESGLESLREERAIICYDWDRDGDLDIASLSVDGALTYSENKSKNNNNYLLVQVEGPQSNTDAIGYSVVVEGKDDGTIQKKAIFSSDHYNSKASKELHYGVGVNKELLITVLDIEGSIVHTEEVDSNRLLQITLNN